MSLELANIDKDGKIEKTVNLSRYVHMYMCWYVHMHVYMYQYVHIIRRTYIHTYIHTDEHTRLYMLWTRLTGFDYHCWGFFLPMIHSC